MTSTPTLPTEQDLTGLPYFAILALGARSARYAEPMFRLWELASDEHVRGVSAAIQAVEDLAGYPDALARAPYWVSAADTALLAAVAASAADCASAPDAALHAADSAAELANAIDPGCPRERAARAVLKSIQASANAIGQGGSEEGEFLTKIGKDIERLKSHTSAEGWIEETGIPAQILAS